MLTTITMWMKLVCANDPNKTKALHNQPASPFRFCCLCPALAGRYQLGGVMDWVLYVTTEHMRPSIEITHGARFNAPSAAACESRAVELIAEVVNDPAPYLVTVNGQLSVSPFKVTVTCSDGWMMGERFKIAATHELSWKPYHVDEAPQFLSDIRYVDGSPRKPFAQSQALCLEGYTWGPCQ